MKNILHNVEQETVFSNAVLILAIKSHLIISKNTVHIQLTFQNNENKRITILTAKFLRKYRIISS